MPSPSAGRLAALAELADLRKTRARRRFEILAALTRLRQLSCHPALVEPSWTRGSAKLELAVSTIAELRHSGHRALVFSRFTRYLAMLRKILDRRGISHLYLDGSTSGRARQRRMATSSDTSASSIGSVRP